MFFYFVLVKNLNYVFFNNFLIEYENKTNNLLKILNFIRKKIKNSNFIFWLLFISLNINEIIKLSFNLLFIIPFFEVIFSIDIKNLFELKKRIFQ